MAPLAAAPPQRAATRAVFELLAAFLEGCGLPQPAQLLRAQGPAVAAEPHGKGDAGFLPRFRELAESLSLILIELEADAGAADAVPPDRTALDKALESLVRQLAGEVTENGSPPLSPTLSALAAPPPEPARSLELPRQSEAAAGARPAASAHYLPRRGVTATEPDAEDEYHDDEDPGYRIREIYETELLAELAQKLQARGSQPAEEAPPEKQPAADEVRRPQHVRHASSGDGFYPAELDGTVFDSFSLRVVFERDKTGFEESKEFAININSVVAARYQMLEYLGSAAFSRAVQCLDLETNRMVCMKIIKNDKDFFDQSLDEIKLLKFINANGDPDQHGVLRLYDYFYHKEHLIIVTELLRENLYEFSKINRESGDAPFFTLGRVQKVAFQVLSGLEYVHSLRLIHCDLKPENILMKSYSRCEVKVIDFGSSCFLEDHLSSYVQSRSYRAPEVMLGLPYGQKIDLWSLGCILAELWTGYVLFQNDSVQSLLARIVGILGPFPNHLMLRGRHVPQYFTQDGQLYQEIEGPSCQERGRRLHLLVPKKTSLRQRMRTDCEEFLDLLQQLLQLDPDRRPTASEALKHPFLTSCKFPDGI